MNHYTYMITVKNPTDSRRFYVGVRSCKGIPEQDRYIGSSKHFAEWRKQNPIAVIEKQVLAVWPTRQEAMSHEMLLHDCFDIPKNPEFWNKAKLLTNGFTTAGIDLPNKYKKGQISPRKGVKLTVEQIENARLRKLGTKHSEETKKRMSKSQTGRKWSEEHKQKFSEIHKGKIISEETKEKIRIAHLGNKHSLETRKKMSASRSGEKYYHNGNVSIRCKPENKPEGFVNGLLRRKRKNVYA
jgi:hypothetical protein